MVEAMQIVSYLSTWPITTTLMCIFSLPMIAVLSLKGFGVYDDQVLRKLWNEGSMSFSQLVMKEKVR